MSELYTSLRERKETLLNFMASPHGRKHGVESWQVLFFESDARAIRRGLRRLGVRGQEQCGQATKGMWGMSWRQKAMKGVEDCDKLGVAVNQALIPRFPNYHTLNP